MGPKSFYEAIRKGGIADIHYPLKGVKALLPNGFGIYRNLRSYIEEIAEEKRYEHVKLPSTIPEEYTDHLRKKEMFKAGNSYNEFFLAGSVEPGASLIADRLVKTYKDLPVKLFSKNNVYRETDSSSLVKMVEYESMEFNSFYKNSERARQEKENLKEVFGEFLDRKEIPFVRVSKGENIEAFYSYLPFAEKFASVFWVGVVDDKYSNMTGATYHSRDNERKRISQLNAGITERVLAAYLSNHFDGKRFLIDREDSNYDLFINSKGDNDSILERLEEQYSVKNNYNSRKEAVELFQSSAIPLFVSKGVHEYLLINLRDMDGEWVEGENIEARINEEYKKYNSKPLKKDIKIRELEGDNPEPDIAYLVDNHKDYSDMDFIGTRCDKDVVVMSKY